MRRLPGPARPVATCAALALVGHVALLAAALWVPEHGAPAGGDAAPPDRLIRVSLRPAPAPVAPALPDRVADVPALPTPSEDEGRDTPSAAMAAQAKPVPTTPGDKTGETSPAAAPPRFATLPAARGMPDAALPDGGVRVNVLVRAGPDGQPADIATAVWPADADVAYAHWAERSLAEARLAPDGPGPHCLQVSFEPGQDQPRWAWWPWEGASADRCLSGRLPGATRPLPAR